MMFWYDHDVSGWGWFAMSASMILFWALIITAAVLLFRALNRAPEHTHMHGGPSPEQLLAERFARGDIDEEEYQRRLAALRSSGPLTKH
ncbi:SHOCT domain-containing protein [Streptomyces sp. NBC_00885]|uniref:SHOCT domain-containing protein n=2 Tax=unclassified Streptomyces TaxID=2593676 RepID=UPI00386C1323|nr:SHOCT domain-containing protein [Streptomyces sp. NBC_00885]